MTVAVGLDGSYLGGDSGVAYLLMAAHGFSAGRRDPYWRGLGGPIALTAAAEFACYRHGDPPGVYVFIVGATWLGGRALRGREQLAASLAERIDELGQEEEAYAQLSVRYERARIAADLHDLVAHAISVMVIQAGAGQRLAGHDPEAARDAFAVIARAAREAESDLERLVTLLGDETATGNGTRPRAGRGARRTRRRQRPRRPSTTRGKHRQPARALRGVRPSRGAGGRHERAPLRIGRDRARARAQRVAGHARRDRE